MDIVKFSILYARAVDEVKKANEPLKDEMLNYLDYVYKEWVNKHFPNMSDDDLVKMVNTPKPNALVVISKVAAIAMCVYAAITYLQS